MLRYVITDVSRAATDAQGRRGALRDIARHWSTAGVNFVQLREKSLPAGELLELALLLQEELRASGGSTRLLVNGRVDVAVAAGVDGVHLPAAPGELLAEQARLLFARAELPRPLVSVSCHTAEEVRRASDADLILFGPVFEKVVGGASVAPGAGLALLEQAVAEAGRVPVLGLGGVTAANTPACLATGAAGVAGIRLFS